MDGFNYQLNESNVGGGGGETMDHLGFMNRSDFSGNDGMDRVLFDAQESLLPGEIGPMSGGVDECQDTSSFLNPINDILGDINEFNKNFCCGDQVTALHSLPCSAAAVVPLQSEGNNSGSWSALRDPAVGNVNTNAHCYAEGPKPVADTGIDSVGLFSIVDTNSTVEFSSECTFGGGGEYTSTINQWLQSLEHQQQMTFLSTITPPTPPTLSGNVATVGYSDSFLSTIGSLPASTTITPITVEEHQLQVHHQRPQSPLPQQEVTIEARFLASEKVGGSCNSFFLSEDSNLADAGGGHNGHNSHALQEDVLKRRDEEWHYLQSPVDMAAVAGYSHPPLNFTTGVTTGITSMNMAPAAQQFSQRKSTAFNASTPRPRIPTIGFQKNRLHWTAVFPRKQFIQPPEMIIMHPLRTRKLMQNPRRTATAGCSNGCDVGDNDAINLSEYFDTSAINIPMIRERSRSQGRNENRRKQKLNIIPGSENLIFEVQRNQCNDSEEFIQIPTLAGEQFNADVDPYPETELPELDEIFRRKKKTATMPNTGNKRSYSILQSTCGGLVAGAPPLKKQCQISAAQHPSVSLQESSTSFEEKISVSIAIRKGRSNLSIDKNDLILSSESDSGESNDGNDKDKTKTQDISKSLKCQKCRKLFKTTRSLAIHTKRCTVVQRDTSPSSNQVFEEDAKHDHNSSTGNGKQAHNVNIEMKSLPKLNRIHQEDDVESLEISFCCAANSEGQINLKISSSSPNDESKARPITRSQTRRSTGRSIQLSNTKRSK